MTRDEWDKRWWEIHSYLQSQNDPKAFEKAHEVMEKKYGPRPDGPPSVQWIAFKMWWLVKVKHMDLTKLLWSGAFAFLAGGIVVLAPLAGDGVSKQDLLVAVGAGLTALAAYLKDPNAHKGPDPR